MNDPGFNTLLKWGLSGGTENLDPNAQNAFLQMLGYELPTEADNMRLYMYNILMHKDAKQDLKEDATEQEKKDAQNAFDLIQWCFEELETSAGQIDSGNNLEVLRVNDWVKKVQEKVKENKDVKEKPAEIEGGNLTLWENLVALLEHEKAQIREGAAWCLATAVDNNSRNQNKLTTFNVVPTLVKLATEDADTKVRRKAILALSSGSRNSQANLDTFIKHLPDHFKPQRRLDASNMDDVDSVTNTLRAHVKKMEQEKN